MCAEIAPNLSVDMIAILLGHLKLPFEKIKEAILACDHSVLSEQHLRQMEAFAPDKKEVSGLETETLLHNIIT